MDTDIQDWWDRVPKSLADAYLYATNLYEWMYTASRHAGRYNRCPAADELDDHERVVILEDRSRAANAFVAQIFAIRQSLPSFARVISRVADEFAAVNPDVVHWERFMAPSNHELAVTLAQHLLQQVLRWVAATKLDRETPFDVTEEELARIVPRDILSFIEPAIGAFSVHTPPSSEFEQYQVRLVQELCRAINWRFLTKRGYPDDGEPMVKAPASTRGLSFLREPFVPTALQRSILRELKGRALTKEKLADACKIDPSRLYRPGGLGELQEMNLVRNKRGVGYYRPDAPPPGAIEQKTSPKRPQTAPDQPPTSP